MRLWIFVATLTSASATLERVFLSDACPNVVVADLAEAATSSTLAIRVYLSNERALSSQLFATARRLAEEERRQTDGAGGRGATVHVVADCASELVGFDYTDYLVGMDCGSARAADAMREVDAFDERRGFSIALERVIRRVDEWHDGGACRVWGSDAIRAAVFWLVVALGVAACRRCRRRNVKDA